MSYCCELAYWEGPNGQVAYHSIGQAGAPSGDHAALWRASGAPSGDPVALWWGFRGLLPGTPLPCGGEFGGSFRGPRSPPRPARCGLMFLLALCDLAVPPRTPIPLRSPPATASRSPISRSGNDNWTQRALRCNTLSSIARLQLRYTCLSIMPPAFKQSTATDGTSTTVTVEVVHVCRLCCLPIQGL